MAAAGHPHPVGAGSTAAVDTAHLEPVVIYAMTPATMPTPGRDGRPEKRHTVKYRGVAPRTRISNPELKYATRAA